MTNGVQHISITCPNCGKQYSKVPYAVIKQYHFAFCKKCNLKFHISAQELEEALRQALGLPLPEPAPAAAFAAAVPDEPACDEQPASAQEDVVAEQEPPAGTAPPDDSPAEEPQQDEPVTPPGLEQAIGQRLTDLAATMEETFSPQESLSATIGQDCAAEPAARSAPADDLASLPSEIEIDFPAEPEESPAAEQIEEPAGARPEEEFSFSFQEPAPQPFAGDEPAAQDLPFEAAAEQEQELYPEADLLAGPQEEDPDLSLDGPQPEDFSLAGMSIDFDDEPAAEQQGYAADEDFHIILPQQNMPSACQEKELQSGDDVLEAILGQDLDLGAGQHESAAGQVAGEDLVQQAETVDGQAPLLAVEQFEDQLPESESVPPAEQPWPDEPPFVDSAFTEKESGSGEPPVYYDDQGNILADPFVHDTPDEVFQQIQQLSSDDQPPEELPDNGSFQEIDADAADSFGPDGQKALSDGTEEEQFSPEAGEELFDDDLLEEALEEQAGDAAAQQYLQPSQPDASLFDAIRRTDGSTRDISAMLKDLVQPGAEIEEGMEQFVLFTLGERDFAMPIANVLELSLPPDVIPVPNTPAWITGICNLRGEIISVVDLKGFLGIESEAFKKSTRMIVAQTLDRMMCLGLVIDRINGIKYFQVDMLQPLSQPAPGISGSFALGAGEHEGAAVVFLDLEQILQSPKMRQFQ